MFQNIHFEFWLLFNALHFGSGSRGVITPGESMFKFLWRLTSLNLIFSRQPNCSQLPLWHTFHTANCTWVRKLIRGIDCLILKPQSGFGTPKWTPNVYRYGLADTKVTFVGGGGGSRYKGYKPTKNYPCPPLYLLKAKYFCFYNVFGNIDQKWSIQDTNVSFRKLLATLQFADWYCFRLIP